MRSFLLSIFLFSSISFVTAQNHIFSFGRQDFLLDGKPFQIISGEMHPARIPKAYWRHRIQMAKAMGCNTIAVYVFWNYQESAPGIFDFSSGNKDIAGFIRLCKEEGMWVLLRPGPYVCAEWDFGGLPSYLLKIPDIKLRCMDINYMKAVSRYINRLAKEIVPLQCNKGGPVLMLQIENEYGSYGNDKKYLEALKNLWLLNGIVVPFYTSDGPTDFMLEAGNIEGAAIGLDSGTGDADFATAKKHNPRVPSFSSETYPGWLTHWKENWQKTDTARLLGEVKYLLEHKKSFNLYVIHGGTNFGFTSGANAFTPVQFQPDVTSYDYDAPVNEQGRPSPKYFALRNLIQKYVKHTLPDIPRPIPAMALTAFRLQPFATLWKELPKAIHSVQPKPMEDFDQKNGYILYRTKLTGHKSGKLTITEPHDYAVILLNGRLVDTVYRDGGNWTVNLPKTNTKDPVLDILVESMGHINFAQYMTDRKGITDRVTLNGMTLMNWEIFTLPMDEEFISSLQSKYQDGFHDGVFFRGHFEVTMPMDTYLDMTDYKKGVAWINGHNLGRYWNTGPQHRLYCPGVWLKKGKNELILFDLHQQEAASVSGEKTLQ